MRRSWIRRTRRYVKKNKKKRFQKPQNVFFYVSQVSCSHQFKFAAKETIFITIWYRLFFVLWDHFASITHTIQKESHKSIPKQSYRCPYKEKIINNPPSFWSRLNIKHTVFRDTLKFNISADRSLGHFEKTKHQTK